MDLTKLLDFRWFAEKFLRIRKRDGSIEPFTVNRAQEYALKAFEQQITETGKLRIIALKGRQMGFSTLVQGYYFHDTITHSGIKTFILTHEAEATKNLFEMTRRFYEKLPPGLCPQVSKNSAREMYFSAIDSGYSVGTAGNKGAGRSQTVQNLHGSEAAFWPNAEEHAMGLMQAVGTQAGTKVILESTANGIGNYFHSMWMAAERGTNGFIPLFLPWYWQDEYTRFERGFVMTAEERQLLEEHLDNGMTEQHVAWRRSKVFEFNQDWDIGLIRFQQEYPCFAAEAFRAPIHDAFIHSSHVTKARKTKLESDSPLIIGVDPAIGDNDRCVIIRRKGRLVFGMEILRNHNTMELAGRLKHIIETERPAKVFIDSIGIGAGTVDRLKEMGKDCVMGVNVARTANQKEKYANLRAELWSEMRDWLTGELPVAIPDSDELHKDLCNLGFKHRSNGQLLIESKDDLKKRGLPSCDCADAMALTFTLGVHAGATDYHPSTIHHYSRECFT